MDPDPHPQSLYQHMQSEDDHVDAMNNGGTAMPSHDSQDGTGRSGQAHPPPSSGRRYDMDKELILLLTDPVLDQPFQKPLSIG